MIFLGIETSCDETAVGIVDGHKDAALRIRANIVASQLDEHRPYGGVVPEIAARAHLNVIDGVVRRALDEGKLTLDDVAGIAATCGPGLIGGLMVGAMMGKAMAVVRKRPFVAVNHLEGHALTARLTHNVAFPYLLLLISGGHCQLLLARGVGDYRRLGTTVDDAVGECFDKGATLLGLGYPGGPRIEQAAMQGRADAFALPRPMVGRDGCDFSCSGLKTALRQVVAAQNVRLSAAFVADAAASLQAAIADILVDRTRNALEILRNENQTISALVVGGGVASNHAIRSRLSQLTANFQVPFVAPPAALCTDNGVMIAWAGLERFRLGMVDGCEAAARPRWPLDQRMPQDVK
jgi:N6-L-threonylcarbamoyladenine synthase